MIETSCQSEKHGVNHYVITLSVDSNLATSIIVNVIAYF